MLLLKILCSLITMGCCWGCYEAFALNNTREIDGVYHNWPFLLFMIVAAIVSWFIRV